MKTTVHKTESHHKEVRAVSVDVKYNDVTQETVAVTMKVDKEYEPTIDGIIEMQADRMDIDEEREDEYVKRVLKEGDDEDGDYATSYSDKEVDSDNPYWAMIAEYDTEDVDMMMEVKGLLDEVEGETESEWTDDERVPPYTETGRVGKSY